MRKTGFSMDYIQKNRSVMRVIECSIRNHWTYTAFSDYNTNISFTFQDLANQIRKMHIFFEENGIKKGDKVAVCDKNSSYWAISTISALTYGAVVVPILVDFHGEVYPTPLKLG